MRFWRQTNPLVSVTFSLKGNGCMGSMMACTKVEIGWDQYISDS